MKYLIFGWMVLVLFVSCEEDVVDLSAPAETPVSAEAFLHYFPIRSLPYKIVDTSLVGVSTDSLLIYKDIVYQFIPDSVFKKEFGKKGKIKFHALGRAIEKGKETYLLLKATSGRKSVAYLSVFDKEGHFICAMPLIKKGFEPYDLSYGILDNKFQITEYREKLDANSLHFKRNIYIYNEAANLFTLIMTEPNEDIIAQIIDPIDSLSMKQSFSGNYVQDEKNFITIRDGAVPKERLFFIHFEKTGGNCVGELKGTLRITNKNRAIYQEPGNTCAIQFDFKSNELTMKEIGGCGAYRDIKCFFDGTYALRHKPKRKGSLKNK